MGADQFVNHASGMSVQTAFSDAVKDAQYEHGHGGYSGTLAEKSTFKLFAMPEGLSKDELLEHCWQPSTGHTYSLFFNQVYEAVDDKWGDAGAIEVPCDARCKHEPSLKHFVFFGWASS